MINRGASELLDEAEGVRRVVIRDVRPQIDDGEYAVKRIVGDVVAVSAVVFADGHDAVACQVLYQHDDDVAWKSYPLAQQDNDLWTGAFEVTRVGIYTFTIQGWIDRFTTWRNDLAKRIAAAQDLKMPILAGAALVSEAALRVDGGDARILSLHAEQMSLFAASDSGEIYACPEDIVGLMARYPDLGDASMYKKVLSVRVDRPKARYSTWYEMFPRSAGAVAGQHGSLKDCEEKIAVVAGLGFDVLYLPPIHPIGETFRKGRNNATTADPGDVGSPWAIGSKLGGHKAIHPELGSLADFLSLVQTANDNGVEIALDIAFQCSPDHPYVREHPEWFSKRADGSIQYAENPPKKYQDIYPLNFGTPDWRNLWNELKSVFVYWIQHGVRIFRVDNPHTKALVFWKWVIAEIKQTYPDVIFLAEAFTRPHVMHELAKLGFTQSYTYFTWRNGREELEEYLLELTSEPINDFFGPNFWPNTPDILPIGLQHANPSRFALRLFLAATLSASYGIYGSAFELCENLPKGDGSEEYLNSEKYELKQWNPDPEIGLRPLIKKINGARAENSALQTNGRPHFHRSPDNSVIAYSKSNASNTNVIFVVLDLDPVDKREAVVRVDRSKLGGIQGCVHLRNLLSGADVLLDSDEFRIVLDAESPFCLYSVEACHATGAHA